MTLCLSLLRVTVSNYYKLLLIITDFAKVFSFHPMSVLTTIITQTAYFGSRVCAASTHGARMRSGGCSQAAAGSSSQSARRTTMFAVRQAHDDVRSPPGARRCQRAKERKEPSMLWLLAIVELRSGDCCGQKIKRQFLQAMQLTESIGEYVPRCITMPGQRAPEYKYTGK